MNISFNTLRGKYKAYVHRDVLKVTYQPRRDWYFGICCVGLFAAIVVGMMITWISSVDKISFLEDPVIASSVILDDKALEEIVRYYEDKEAQFNDILP
jgi:hypothetical protein